MARQLILWAAVLLMIGAIAAAIAPAPERPTAPVFPAPAHAGAAPARTVEGALPSRTPVEAVAGDIVRLSIESEQPARALVSGMGVSAPVGPGSEGVVEFVADLPGRWTVRLVPGGALIGVLEVSG
jgi:hypothetical protein